MQDGPGTLDVFVAAGWNTDNTIEITGGATYQLSPYIMVKAGYGWNNSSLNRFEFGGGLQYKVTPDLEPYAWAGATYNTDNTLVPAAGAGFRYKVSPEVKLVVEYGWNNSSLQFLQAGLSYRIQP
uniref:De novo designed transmembrane beta-barrel TMB2.3 n=1 Tax=synthetic construct TaxID=32630 RepID=UPI00194ADA1B|nr:Chain A, De novo designed transmembrane beta-barrel TMB2.3 [synthetic construct]